MSFVKHKNYKKVKLIKNNILVLTLLFSVMLHFYSNSSLAMTKETVNIKLMSDRKVMSLCVVTFQL